MASLLPAASCSPLDEHGPDAAYLEPDDLVLVLDVNECYRPWLVASDRLFQAVDTDDSGQKRGL